MMKKIEPVKVFFAISIINIFIMVCLIMGTSGEMVRTMGYGESKFGDLRAHLGRLLQDKSLYGNGEDADAIFPPLAYCFLSVFANVVRNKVDAGISPKDAVNSGYGMLAIAMYLVLFSVIFVQIINCYYKGSNIQKITLGLIFLLSYPFWGCAFERGNPVLWAMLFLLLGMVFMDSDNRILRELALICIAIAAGFKIYPALFGLIYLAEKRYKEAVRLIIYGILFFFVPFIFVGERPMDYLMSFTLYTGKDMYSQTSIMGNFIAVFGDVGKTLGKIAVVVWMLWVMFYLFTEKVNWKSIALLTSSQTIIIAESYVYTYVFIVIPAILFLNNMLSKQRYQKMDYVYAVLFACVFTIPPFTNINCGVLIGIYISWILILVLISVEKFGKLIIKRQIF